MTTVIAVMDHLKKMTHSENKWNEFMVPLTSDGGLKKWVSTFFPPTADITQSALCSFTISIVKLSVLSVSFFQQMTLRQ